MEALYLRKALVVVTNDALMHNHQTELAGALEARGHLKSTTCGELKNVLREVAGASFVDYPPKELEGFPALVDREMGFSV